MFGVVKFGCEHCCQGDFVKISPARMMGQSDRPGAGKSTDRISSRSEFVSVAEGPQLVPCGRARVWSQNLLGKQEVFPAGDGLHASKATRQASPELVWNQLAKEKVLQVVGARIIGRAREFLDAVRGVVVVELELRRFRLNLSRRRRPFRVGCQLGRWCPDP